MRLLIDIGMKLISKPVEWYKNVEKYLKFPDLQITNIVVILPIFCGWIFEWNVYYDFYLTEIILLKFRGALVFPER